MVWCLKMNLPHTIHAEHGLTVEGAGPELLSELLDEYESILKRTSPRIWESLLPGLSRDQIVTALESEGLKAPEELIVWWSWHNGHREGFPHGLRNSQYSLSTALQLRAVDHETAFEWLPSPRWFRVAGEGGKHSIAVSCDPEIDPPWVRSITPEFNLEHEQGPRGRAVSLCTYVTWLLFGIEKGWNRFDPMTGFWRLEDYSAFPEDWRLTGII